MSACMAMYLLAAAHLGISTWSIHTRQRNARDLLRALTLCLGLRTDGAHDFSSCNEATFVKDGVMEGMMSEYLARRRLRTLALEPGTPNA